MGGNLNQDEHEGVCVLPDGKSLLPTQKPAQVISPHRGNHLLTGCWKLSIHSKVIVRCWLLMEDEIRGWDWRCTLGRLLAVD